MPNCRSQPSLNTIYIFTTFFLIINVGRLSMRLSEINHAGSHHPPSQGYHYKVNCIAHTRVLSHLLTHLKTRTRRPLFCKYLVNSLSRVFAKVWLAPGCLACAILRTTATVKNCQHLTIKVRLSTGTIGYDAHATSWRQ